MLPPLWWTTCVWLKPRPARERVHRRRGNETEDCKDSKMANPSIIVSRFRISVGLFCALVLGSAAATAQSTRAGQSPVKPVLSSATSQPTPAKKLFIAPVWDHDHRLNRNDDIWKRYSDAYYFQEQIFETVGIWRLDRTGQGLSVGKSRSVRVASVLG